MDITTFIGKDGYISITRRKLGDLEQQYGRKKVIEGISDWVREHPPLKSYSISQQQVQEMYQTLSSLHPSFSHPSYTIKNIEELPSQRLVYEKQQTILEIQQEYCYNMDLLAEYFQDAKRLKTKRLDSDLSPWDD